MRWIPALVLLTGTTLSAPAIGDRLADARPGDAEALRRAMAQVASDDRRVIRLEGRRFELDTGPTTECRLGDTLLPPVEGRVTLAGGGAVIAGDGAARLPFCVEPGGTLILRNLTIRNFGTTPSGGSVRPETIVAANSGLLRLVRVTVRENGSVGSEGDPLATRILLNTAPAGGPDGRMEIVGSVISDNAGVSGEINRGGILQNFGELLIQDSSLTNNRVRRYYDDPRFDFDRPVAFSFHAPTELRNTTVSGNSHGVDLSGTTLVDQTTIVNNGFALVKSAAALTVVRNSIIGPNDNVDCVLRSLSPFAPGDLSLTTEGVNLDSDDTCGLDPETDLVATDPRLEPLQRLEGGIPGHQPSDGSPVVNRGAASFCPFRDAAGRIRDTNADADDRCALGAIEPPNEAPDFEIDARLTGTWYDPQHDGHYLSFQVLPDDRVAATWWTYDPQGNPLWLIGSGNVDGDTARIEVFSSRGMTLPRLDDEQREQTRWGTLELEFENCRGLEMRWATDRPDFTNGEATLRRLTFNEGLHC